MHLDLLRDQSRFAFHRPLRMVRHLQPWNLLTRLLPQPGGRPSSAIGLIPLPVSIRSRQGNSARLSSTRLFLVCLTMLAISTVYPAAHAQSGEWAWMSGSNTPNQAGVYGTQGTPAAANVPGARYGAATWTDASGHFWLFGGNGLDSTGTNDDLNDLWEFDASTSQWTWISGSSGVRNHGVYGTLGTPAPGNTPGARDSAVSWTDSSGHLWLFGGEGYDSAGTQGFLNDLWEFDPSTSEWTWVSGSSSVPAGSGPAGVYGALGTPSSGSIPGGRFGATGWIDKSGDLWLFGGDGDDSTDTLGRLNDLWEFNPSTSMWTWMGGSSTLGTDGLGIPGVYGTQGTPAATNAPGSRDYAMGWTDANGHFWLFGGEGNDGNAMTLGGFTTSDFGYLNDLWEYNPTTSEWTWVGGSSIIPNGGLSLEGNPGIYGTEGVSASGNIPGGRDGGITWADHSGHLWLLAGFGANFAGTIGYLNDLWMYDLNSNQWAWMGGSNATLGDPGVYGTLGVPAAGNAPGARESGMSWTDGSGNLWLFGGGYEGSYYTEYLNDLWEYTPSNTTTASTVTLSPADLTFGSQAIGITSSAQTIMLTNSATTPLTIDSISATGDFAATNDCGSSVAAGASCTISVTFTPTTTGTRAGILTISDNATGSPQTASLTGTGIVGTPGATVSPTSLAFGSQPVGTTSPAQTVTLTNSGTASLNVLGITIIAPYAETNNCGTSLAPGASCTISVTFAPPGPVNYPGTLIIGDNADDGSQTVSLTGMGGANAATVTLSPTSLTFPSQTEGTTSAAQAVTLTNSGTAAVSITSIAASGDFAQTNTCGSSVAAGANCTISVTFTPSAVGTSLGTLIAIDSAAGSPQSVSLSGTGTAPVVTAPAVTLAPTSLTFASQNTGSTSAAQTVMLTNSGSGALSITSIAATGDFAETNTCGSSVAAAASCIISVTFTPTSGGTRTGTLTITDNASGSPQTVSLTGTGSTVSESPSSNSLTISSAGGSATDTITLSSAGGFSGTVNLSCSVTYTGSGTATDAPTCTLSPTQAQVSSGSTASTTLTVSTTAASSARLSNPFLPLGGGGALAAALIFIGVPRRRWRGLCFLAILGFAIAGICVGCGGSSGGSGGSNPPGNPGTATGNYSVTVTATGGTMTSSVSIPLAVQ